MPAHRHPHADPRWKAVRVDLLGPLQRDARINDDICEQVRAVYFKLPSNIQVHSHTEPGLRPEPSPRPEARILLTAIQHPHAKTNATAFEQAQMVRDLLSAGGA